MGLTVRSIAIINQKGGCGKTTTAINLAGCFARVGMPTLLVDMDPQSHCAAGLAIPEQRVDLDVGDAMLIDPKRPLDAERLLWRAARNLDLAPSRTRMAGLEAGRGGLDRLPDKELRLKGLLGRFTDRYEACVIDCSPSLGLLAYNAMSAADAILVPVETSYFSLHGAAKQINAIASLSRRLKLSLPVWLVPTIHDPDDALARDLLAELNERYGGQVAPCAIRIDRRLKEAASFGQPIFEYAPGSQGAHDYAQLASWLADLLDLPIPDEAALAELRSDPAETIVDTETPARQQPEAIASPAAEIVAADPPVAQPLVPPVAEATPPAVDHLASQPPIEPAGEDGPALSRADDLLRRAQALQRRREGVGARLELVEPKPEPLRVPVGGGGNAMRRLYGARPTTSGVLFVQPLATGRSIAIAGDFNQWSADAHPMRRNEELGVFELLVPVGPGRHHYRLVVDGDWRRDPYNPSSEPNPFGGANSVVEVAATVRTAPIRSPHRSHAST